MTSHPARVRRGRVPSTPRRRVRTQSLSLCSEKREELSVGVWVVNHRPLDLLGL